MSYIQGMVNDVKETRLQVLIRRIGKLILATMLTLIIVLQLLSFCMIHEINQIDNNMWEILEECDQVLEKEVER